MIDKHSNTWREIAAWAEAELSKATRLNETIGLATPETENLRGRIATLRDLLALANDPEPHIVVQGAGYDFQEPDT